MGTTLTGTTPQDTYDSLIKVTDNGPLSGTAKLLTDGLGNNSILALSTTAVGIGTTSPTANLDARIAGTTSGAVIKVGNVGTGDFGGLAVSDGGTYPVQLYGSSLAFLTGNSAYASATEKVRITSAGNVGIGTSAPTSLLTIQPANDALDTLRIYRGKDSGYQNQSAIIDGVSGNVNIKSLASDSARWISFQLSSNSGSSYTQAARIDLDGLKFGSDTAAANALDDYEEGTWTPVFTMGTSGTITTGGVSGRYTKVGNLVTCTGFANVSSVLLPVGELRLGGLPFTTGTASDSGISIFAYGFANITAVSTYQGFISAGLTYAIVRGFSNGDQVQNIGANVVGSAGMIFTITYRV